MNKFTLYILTEMNFYKDIFSGEELCNCISYIRQNHLVPHKCVIISPNGRRIGFTSNGSIVFGDVSLTKSKQGL